MKNVIGFVIGATLVFVGILIGGKLTNNTWTEIHSQPFHSPTIDLRHDDSIIKFYYDSREIAKVDGMGDFMVRVGDTYKPYCEAEEGIRRVILKRLVK